MKALHQITLRQLRALHTVVETANISTAADMLGLTPPAIHSQLKKLEDSIGSPLLIRDGTLRNTPTEQGKLLIAAFSEINASLERAILNIGALDKGLTGNVVLGVVSTAKYFAPRIVSLLQSEIRDIQITLKIGNREAIIAAMARGEYDLCIMGRPPRAPLVKATPLMDHPHIIIAAANHWLAGTINIDTEDLFNERFVLREPGSGTRILATRFLDEIGKGHEFDTIEMNSNETIKQSVLSGLGIALISAHTVAEELESGRLKALPVHGTPIIRKWFVLTLKDATLSPAAKRIHHWLTRNPERYFPHLPC